MPFAHRIPSCNRHRRGFTYVEIAIVFGILVIVMSGLFGLASVSHKHRQYNEASDELAVLVDNARNYYTLGGYPSPTLATCFSGASAFVRPATSWGATQINSSGLFPIQMVQPVGTSVYIAHPLSPKPLTAHTVQTDLCGTDPVLLGIQFKNIGKESCINMVITTAARAGGTELARIAVNGVVVTMGNNGTVSLDDATTRCGATTNRIDWYYRLGG